MQQRKIRKKSLGCVKDAMFQIVLMIACITCLVISIVSNKYIINTALN